MVKKERVWLSKGRGQGGRGVVKEEGVWSRRKGCVGEAKKCRW